MTDWFSLGVRLHGVDGLKDWQRASRRHTVECVRGRHPWSSQTVEMKVK